MVAVPNRSPGPLFLRDSRALKISQNETIRKLVATASINRLHFLLVPLPSCQEDWLYGRGNVHFRLTPYVSVPGKKHVAQAVPIIVDTLIASHCSIRRLPTVNRIYVNWRKGWSSRSLDSTFSRSRNDAAIAAAVKSINPLQTITY
jgi:hypothetical protein